MFHLIQSSNSIKFIENIRVSIFELDTWKLLENITADRAAFTRNFLRSLFTLIQSGAHMKVQEAHMNVRGGTPC
jgi:hypothetical protein